jgi:AraC-like DNA-binding protein
MSTPTIEEPIAERRPLPRGDVRALPARRLRRVTEYIRQNLDKGLSLGELAAVVCMSPYHFARLFKYSTGVPPHRFVVRQRIAQARAWLARPELSIAQISRLVGFRTPSHFTTVFRRLSGVTPRRYRLAARGGGGSARTESEMDLSGVVQSGGLRAGGGFGGGPGGGGHAGL